MNEKTYSVAIIGCGSRGRDVYGRLFLRDKNRWNIVSLCDTDETSLNLAKNDFSVKDELCFLNDVDFFKEKRADLLVIATQDRDHVRMCVKALELGYNVLLEKPISPKEEELKAVLAAQKKYGGKVLVCHVLRYAPAFVKIKELLSSGKLGRLIGIEALEQVGYWHQSHSYVRGNWRREEETSPMIMAKCCHDLDLLQWYADSSCKEVYSVGRLNFFKRENRPAGAADRCRDCKYINSCIYSAENLYVKRWHADFCPEDAWPYNVIDREFPNTEENIRKAYENGPYGRCVFACDNDVVDHQVVVAQFENGVTASLTMTAFTEWGGRKMTFHCTHGLIEFDETNNFIRVYYFGDRKDEYDTRKIAEELGKDYFGHGGGDAVMIKKLYDILSGNSDPETELSRSIESHLMALASEKSRKEDKPVGIER